MLQVCEQQHHNTKVLTLTGQFTRDDKIGIQELILGAKEMGCHHIILDFSGVRMYSYEFDFRKPDTRIFKIAAERIGERPENIMYVGDRIDKDITPTLKLGMHAVLKDAYTNAGKRLPQGARKITHISELPALVETINAGIHT